MSKPFNTDAESDAAFVEYMASVQNGSVTSMWREQADRLISLAREALASRTAAPDAGADEVERVLVEEEFYLKKLVQSEHEGPDGDGPGIMPGDVEGSFHRIASALSASPRWGRRETKLRDAALEVVRAFERGIEDDDRRDPVAIEASLLAELMAAVVDYEASASEPQDDGWRDIASAPRDGTWVLLAGPSGYSSTPLRVEVCRYYPEYRPLNPWQNHGNDAFTDGGAEPTHWRPLPSAPSARS